MLFRTSKAVVISTQLFTTASMKSWHKRNIVYFSRNIEINYRSGCPNLDQRKECEDYPLVDDRFDVYFIFKKVKLKALTSGTEKELKTREEKNE